MLEAIISPDYGDNDDESKLAGQLRHRRTHVATEAAKWAPLARAAGIRLD